MLRLPKLGFLTFQLNSENSVIPIRMKFIQCVVEERKSNH